MFSLNRFDLFNVKMYLHLLKLTFDMKFPTIKLTDEQIKQIASILSDIGTLTAASTIIPFLLSEFRPIQLIIGGIISSFFWLISIKYQIYGTNNIYLLRNGSAGLISLFMGQLFRERK